MKKNLLPSMQKISMKDKNGSDFSMSIEVRRNETTTYVFVADTHQLGSSRIAQDAVYYFDKLCRLLKLDGDKTVFFRHIYQEHMGSLFGRFLVNWNAQPEPSYRFQMLTNIDDLQSVNRLLTTSTKLNVEELRKSASAAKVANA